MKENEIIVSIDPGLVNLGVAIASVTNSTLCILDVERVDLTAISKTNQLKAIKKYFDQKLAPYGKINRLVIERQPPVNKKMTKLAFAIKAYFTWMHESVKITEIHAKKKTIYFQEPLFSKYKGEYAKRKDISIQQIQTLAQSTLLCDKYKVSNASLLAQIEKINKDKKKDEYCDVINQLIAEYN